MFQCSLYPAACRNKKKLLHPMKSVQVFDAGRFYQIQNILYKAAAADGSS